MSTIDASRSIERYCRDKLPDILSLTQQLVDTDSSSSNPAGVDAVAGIAGQQLVGAGFRLERIAPDASAVDDWLQQFFLPEIGGFGQVAHHLVARRAGEEFGHALLIGHMDTAFPVGEPALNPFRIEGDRARGCAVVDMKAGLAVLIFAVKALHDLGLGAPAISVVFDTDEQAGSLTARKVIESLIRSEGVDWAFKAEMARDGGPLIDRRPGIGVGLVEIEGREALAGWGGASAIVALAKKTLELEALTDERPGWVVNVGEVQGGRRRNLVPGYAAAKLGLRASTSEDWDALTARVREITERESVAGTTGSVKIYNHRPAMQPTSATDALKAIIQASGSDLNVPVGFTATNSASDANFPGSMGVPTIDGFGPVGGRIMTRDEFVEIPSLVDQTALLALTLHRLAGSGQAND